MQSGCQTNDFSKVTSASSDNSDSLTDKDTIPIDLFWVICSSDSESERRVLPVMPGIMRRLQNMSCFNPFICVVVYHDVLREDF